MRFLVQANIELHKYKLARRGTINKIQPIFDATTVGTLIYRQWVVWGKAEARAHTGTRKHLREAMYSKEATGKSGKRQKFHSWGHTLHTI